MKYNQFQAHPMLANYIDAYWIVSGEVGLQTEKILPDGCVDLIFNAGEACITDNGNFTMHHGRFYLVGTMTSVKKVNMRAETKLFGIRFKPAAFYHFFRFSSLHEIKNATIEFEKKFSPEIPRGVQNVFTYLDGFLVNRLSKPRYNLLPVVADVQDQMGHIDIKTLAQDHCMTLRQLERLFKQQIGITPKEFSNFVRYQHAHSMIQKNVSNRSLEDIAFECGYYDHSHLTNEFKRYTGSSPSMV